MRASHGACGPPNQPRWRHDVDGSVLPQAVGACLTYSGPVYSETATLQREHPLAAKLKIQGSHPTWRGNTRRGTCSARVERCLLVFEEAARHRRSEVPEHAEFCGVTAWRFLSLGNAKELKAASAATGANPQRATSRGSRGGHTWLDSDDDAARLPRRLRWFT